MKRDTRRSVSLFETRCLKTVTRTCQVLEAGRRAGISERSTPSGRGCFQLSPSCSTSVPAAPLKLINTYEGAPVTKPNGLTTTSKTWTDFAITEATVEHESPLDGNSGTSTFEIKNHSGVMSAKLTGLTQGASTPDRAVTITLTGESEHAQLAEVLRWIADELEKAPHYYPRPTA